jgi:hypothetical protein
MIFAVAGKAAVWKYCGADSARIHKLFPEYYWVIMESLLLVVDIVAMFMLVRWSANAESRALKSNPNNLQSVSQPARYD